MTFSVEDWGKGVANFTLPLDVNAKMVFYFKKAFTVPVSDGLVIAGVGGWIESMWAALHDFTSDAVTLDYVDVYRGTAAAPGEHPDYLYVGTHIVGVAGGNAQDPLPSGVAAVVIALTEIARVVARKFWPGFVVTAVDALGSWIPSVLADLADMYVIYTSRFNYTGAVDPSGDLIAGVYSKKLGAFKVFAWPGAITGIPAYQRRRKPGVGT